MEEEKLDSNYMKFCSSEISNDLKLQVLRQWTTHIQLVILMIILFFRI